MDPQAATLRPNQKNEPTDPYQDREPTIFNSSIIIFFVATALFLALLYRRNDLALLAIVVLLIMGGSKIWGKASLSRVSCTLCVDKERVFPGETLSLTATIMNAKLLPVWVHMRWPHSNAFAPLDEEPLSRNGISLLWHQQARYDRHLVARRRGYYPLGPSHIRTSDLFGFFKSRKKLSAVTPVIVYPRKVALKPVQVPKYDLFGSPGDQSPVKDPVYILGTRDYQPSRPSRYIHWKASARHQRLQEKVFEPSRQGKIMLALDVGVFEKEGLVDEFEHTLEVMASLALRLDEMDFAVGLLTNGRSRGGDYSVVPAGRGPRQLPHILEALARLQMKQNARLSHVLKKIPGSLQGSSCALFCGQKKTDSDRMQRCCRKRNMRLTLFAWHVDDIDPDTRHGGSPAIQTIETLVDRMDAPE